MGSSDGLGHMGRGFADELEIAQGRVIMKSTASKTRLIKAYRISGDLFGERSYRRDRSAIRGSRQTRMASFSIKGRNSGRSAFSVARSTGCRNKSSR